MKLFNCQQCSQTLLFENNLCENCQSELGFLPELMTLSALTPLESGFNALADDSNSVWYYCQNKQHNVCNWMVKEQGELCEACDLNRHIPNLQNYEQQQAWQELESAKHRLVYSLLRLNLPVVSKKDAPEEGLSFDFISEENVVPDGAQTTTGHALGQVTINAAEADSADREQMRKDMNEPYRTLIGHLRHEVGHYYWDHLIAENAPILTNCRQMFGDERADYGEALEKHYETPVANWQENFVSSYASSHPWEDWAETWAHYFHILDTLETAYEFGIQIQPVHGTHPSLVTQITLDPYQHQNFDELLNQYLPLTFAANNLNRSMGQPDLYPFVIVPKVREKLGFIHQLLIQNQANALNDTPDK
ncbi:hypothetical protein MGA5115_01243 [Marinomonas gallaica]|uniref:Zinc-ribbon domain-containing protein n=1 Tax=Marinomonas gallaica TaxID=1806667 RepID=A0A1C3JPL4_9GAMM|nr:putative zinc-binding metallopeptidase [Marinomonas gallaica]SBT17153.1 hypothetical protein MGA5115_01243 [Marinomonas gallaica]SBT19488.1 hypothetical protein MGA5116_00042 [Marinomonas gallaica]